MEIRNAIANPCSFCLRSFKFSSFLLCFKLHGTRTIIDRYFVETRAPCTRQENWCIHHVHVQEYEKNRKSPEAWKITRENYRHHPFFFFFFIHLCKCWCRYIYNNNNNSDDWKCIWSILKLPRVLFAFLYILFRMKCCNPSDESDRCSFIKIFQQTPANWHIFRKKRGCYFHEN